MCTRVSTYFLYDITLTVYTQAPLGLWLAMSSPTPKFILIRISCLGIASDNKGATVCVLFYQAVMFSLYTSSTDKQM